ncbi:hypothetical protein OOZ54_12790 [Rhodopseudomonas palustris]|uniref:hypothetical protein n=1 Tax=Rhodopseudomonas palustris TaxID=1076 RepID=UPI0022F05BC0|nr:hypothetical protein [Rhodopseudomonas palustris]WBU27571.1 hypothetical protein OOZ54_12790 [Rhodopseudomonas palustris]
MNSRKIAKGAPVTYTCGHGDRVSAIVKRRHRDGTATVEARFVMNSDGTERGCYLGFRYRMNVSNLAMRHL